MKVIIFILLLSSFLFSDVYYSKVEPYRFIYVSSDVNGRVEYIDEDSLGKVLGDTSYIKIDSKVDKVEFENIEKKIQYIKNILDLSKDFLQNLKDVLVKKELNYNKTKLLKVKSQIEKDRDFYDLINTKNSVISTKKEIENLKIQLADLKNREVVVKKNLEDKNLRAKGFTLYSLDVKVGQVVNKSTLLAKLADLSKAILTIYVDKEELDGIDKKIIYIDGKKTDYKIDRYLNIADSKNISKYKIQIVVDSPKLFSKLVKIELKGE